MDGWVGRWLGGWVNGWVGEWVGRWVGGWVNGWMHGWTDRWMDIKNAKILTCSLTIRTSSCVCISVFMSLTSRSTSSPISSAYSLSAKDRHIKTGTFSLSKTFSQSFVAWVWALLTNSGSKKSNICIPSFIGAQQAWTGTHLGSLPFQAGRGQWTLAVK